MSSDLVTFLLARLSEREAVAHKAIDAAGGEPAWRVSDEGNVYGSEQINLPIAVGAWDCPLIDLGEHIALWDPAAVLADCAAKRRILALHPTNTQQPYQAQVPGGWFHPPDPFYCDCQSEDGIIFGNEPCETKRLLASVYASHPDFDPVWAVD